MFGLGLYIYAGEDVPSDLSDENASETKKPATRKAKVAEAPVDRLAPIKNAINNTATTDELLDLYLQHQTEVEGNPEIKALFTERKQQLKQAA